MLQELPHRWYTTMLAMPYITQWNKYDFRHSVTVSLIRWVIVIMKKTYTDRLDRYPMGLLLSLGFRGRVTSSQDGNMPFSWSIVTSRPKPVTYSFSGSLDGVSAGVTNVTMLWLPTKSTIRSTPCSFFCFSNSRFLVAVSSSAKLMTAYLSPIIHRYTEIETEQGLTSPPAQYRLSWRQFYRSKDPANSIKVLKGKCYKNKENPEKAIQQYNRHEYNKKPSCH